jgi:hypothetical protein
MHVCVQVLAGGLCVNGTTDGGQDLGEVHETLVQQAMSEQAAVYGPGSLAATFTPTRRSALSHVLELSGDLWNPHASIAVGAPAEAAAGTAAEGGKAGPSGTGDGAVAAVPTAVQHRE